MNGRRVVIKLVFLVLAGLACYAGYRYLHHPPTGGSEAEGEPKIQPVARVQVVPIKQGAVDITTTAYGTVEAAVGDTETFSVPFESRVKRVLVVGGQEVKQDEPLIEVEPSPDAMLQLDQARQQRDAAKNQLDLAKQRLELKLATRQDALAAQQTFEAADLNVHSLQSRGIDGTKTLRAGDQGVVGRVDVQQGQIVPAGTAMLETIGQNQIVVRLGVGSADAAQLHAGQDVRIEPVNGLAQAIDGKILSVTQEVNQQTRLVNVYVVPARGAHLLLNSYVRGKITLSQPSGLVVPAQSVMPEEGKQVMFTVSDGHAVKHDVQLGPEGDGQVLVSGADLQAGQQVVTVGNSQLEDGMTVETEDRQ